MDESAEDCQVQPAIRYFRREARGLGNSIGIEKPPIELAENIFKQGIEAGVSIDSWSRYTAACLLAAVKLQNRPVSDGRFAEASRDGLKSLTNKIHQLSDELGLEVTPRDPEPYIKKYCESCDLNQQQINRALEIAEEAREEVLGSGIAPTSYAAAVVYIVGLEFNLNLTQSKVAEVSGKSEVTIRNRYKDVIEVVNVQMKGRQGRKREEIE